MGTIPPILITKICCFLWHVVCADFRQLAPAACAMGTLNCTTHSCRQPCAVQFSLFLPCALEPMIAGMCPAPCASPRGLEASGCTDTSAEMTPRHSYAHASERGAAANLAVRCRGVHVPPPRPLSCACAPCFDSSCCVSRRAARAHRLWALRHDRPGGLQCHDARHRAPHAVRLPRVPRVALRLRPDARMRGCADAHADRRLRRPAAAPARPGGRSEHARGG